MWSTRHTVNTDEDKELYIKTTLRELVIYLVFLAILCVLTFGMTNSNMFYYTKVMSELFLDSSFPVTKNTFRGVNHPYDFWRVRELIISQNPPSMRPLKHYFASIVPYLVQRT